MIVQNAIKGISGVDERTVAGMFEGGLCCNWFRKVGRIGTSQIVEKLTDTNLDLHVNHYEHIGDETPFISLATGAVERDILRSRNWVHPALSTAIAFGSDHGSLRGEFYLVYCWVVVATNPAVVIESVSEEVRNLAVYRRWSPFQLEGEVTAKIYIPAPQLHRYEKWFCDGRGDVRFRYERLNPAYVDPVGTLANLREAF